ncbi:hypothetical protein RJT34_28256 [Clitoria ternatea]|uniref:Uncharacterized protein n=1 Tax=Clitoria ternatea TaxID=43366 RepID=A0AAN9FAU7_CLITE
MAIRRISRMTPEALAVMIRVKVSFVSSLNTFLRTFQRKPWPLALWDFLSYALTLTGSQVFLTRWFCNLPNYIISAERIKHFTEIPEQPQLWITKGLLLHGLARVG